MLEFIVRRLLLLIPTVILISIISFVIIQLPPGDFLTSYIMTAWRARASWSIKP